MTTNAKVNGPADSRDTPANGRGRAPIAHRDPVVEAVSEALAQIMTRRGGRWVPDPQWATAPRTHEGTAA